MKQRFCVLGLLLLCGCRKESQLRKMFEAKTGEISLPSGDIDLTEPLIVEGATNLVIRGEGTRLRATFDGRALLIIRKSKSVRVENVSFDGNREKHTVKFGLPPSDQPMAAWNKNNGVLVEDSDDVTLRKLTIRNVVSYPVLVNKSRHSLVEEVMIGDSGTVDEKGLNNATGGILFEEGCEQFVVRKCKLRNIRGNGIWTHSLYTSPRNQRGEFQENDIRYVGRDALQAGHAVDLKIVGNTGGFVGFPPEAVDLSRLAVPVVIDTAGNVEKSLYAANQFEEVNGKCIDLDGFHHGTVTENQCVNRRALENYPHGHFGIVLNNSNPDMRSEAIEITKNQMEGFRFGGLFLIGERHVVKDNVFAKINLARCGEVLGPGCVYKVDEPDMLRSGIYLGRGAERAAISKGIVVENNTVSGFGMAKKCIAFAPGVKPAANTVKGNKCVE